VDIGLDTFPHAGATTTMDLLNMGVPVLSLNWPTPAGRLGKSLLTTAGLEEWIASSTEDFVDKGARWAKDLPRLANLRASLREKVGRSPLMDAPRFARAFEGVLREAWQAWCQQAE
jgi:predicted O-linked N-acetylglucosamine transferase (SPINDLY family)